ncbi:MAG TPA: hypothetical protein VF937_16525, partial [Chloroflexota bacterium]
MATTLGQPSSTTPPGAPAGPEERVSARAALAQHRSLARRLLRLALLVAAVAVLARGWVVTDIDLGKL